MPLSKNHADSENTILRRNNIRTHWLIWVNLFTLPTCNPSPTNVRELQRLLAKPKNMHLIGKSI